MCVLYCHAQCGTQMKKLIKLDTDFSCYGHNALVLHCQSELQTCKLLHYANFPNSIFGLIVSSKKIIKITIHSRLSRPIRSVTRSATGYNRSHILFWFSAILSQYIYIYVSSSYYHERLRTEMWYMFLLFDLVQHWARNNNRSVILAFFLIVYNFC